MSYSNPFTLAAKTILVTGASSGIGRAVAVESSKAGAHVIVTGRNEMRLRETFEKLEGTGHKLVVADLSIEHDIEKILTEAQELDGVVHSAGISDPVPFRFVTKEKLNEVFAVNFFGGALLSQKLVRFKGLKKGASVVFISSVSGVYCSSYAGSIYSSTKGAVNGLVKGMALDLADRLIRVNAVCPGMVETNIYQDGRITAEQLDEDRKRYPLKRHGKPEEIAYAVIYLLSDASIWVTGTNLLIDGGYTLL